MSSVPVESANVGTPRYRAADLRARRVDFPTRGSAGKGTAQSTARKIATIAFANLFKILASSKLTANPINPFWPAPCRISTGARVLPHAVPCGQQTFMKLVRYRQGPAATDQLHTANHSMAPFVGCHLASARTTTSPPEINTLSQDVAHGRVSEPSPQ